MAQAIANDNYLNTLVEIDDVQFAEESIGGTYDPNRNDTYDASIYIVNASNSLAVRTSRYATFAGNIVPSGRGTVRGVLTKYNSGYQIILRTERDVKLTLPRIDYFPPKIGTSIAVSYTHLDVYKRQIGLFASLVLTSCVNDTFDDPKINDCVNPGLTKTKEVADIWAMSTAATQAYTADDIIEGLSLIHI